jgi:ATP-dependent Clp protease ATP-binding subunit ClpA
MYDRLTEKTRRVISHARQEAQRMGGQYIGTEHLLLGILKERTGLAATALDRLGVDPGQMRSQVGKAAGAKPTVADSTKQFPFAPHAKMAFEYAAEESKRAGQNYIGTEHLLLGLVQVSDGAAAQALERCGVRLEAVREALAELLGPGEEPPSAPSSACIEARLQDAFLSLAAQSADDPLVQAFKAVLAYYSAEEAAAVQRGDKDLADALRDLYDHTMVVFRKLCEGHRPSING